MENETKREKFIRLAEKRTNKIINSIELLGNLSNTSVYEYTQKDVDKMFKAIEAATADAKRCYSVISAKKEKKFKFDD